MTPPFADTYYFIALLNPDDEGHKETIEYSRLIDRLAILGVIYTPAR